MAARTVTTREYVCNHCEKLEVFDHDADAGKAGWALLKINNTGMALCAEHYDALKRFLNVDTLGAQPNLLTISAPGGGPGEPGYGMIMDTSTGVITQPILGASGEQLVYDVERNGWRVRTHQDGL